MTMEADETTVIERDHLIGRVEEFNKQGYRLVQLHCTKVGDTYEINYSFDLDYQFRNLRIVVGGQAEVPSISGIYWGAFIYENEMHDLFGLTIHGMTVDYRGHLFTTRVPTPFVTKEPDGEH